MTPARPLGLAAAMSGAAHPLVRVTELPGWAADDHAAAFVAFRRSAEIIAATPPAPARLTGDAEAWVTVARAALALPDPVTAEVARQFFETWFVAQPAAAGLAPFLTGYFEPELEGARHATARFQVPLHARPADLVAVTEANRPPNWPADRVFARLSDSGLTPYDSRAAIEDGALADRGLELVYLADPVDAFLAQVQGSCRVRLVVGPGAGATLRLAYDGKTGHPYTSIGRLLIERGLIAAERMTGDVLAAWLRANPAEGRALMRENQSYIFFREQTDLDPTLGAVAAGGVPLTPGRSLAVDAREHAYGAPIWLDADLPLGVEGATTSVRRLMVAQDTGSAIVGPARGDLFVGCGSAAGRVAGAIRHAARGFTVFVPKPNRI